MAEDFDESAALPVDQVISELRASLGITEGESTSTTDDDKGKQAAKDDDDQSAETTVTEKKESEVATDEDDKEEVLTTTEEKEVKKDTPEGPSSALAKILAKYGYDEEKFAEGWYNLQNSTALVAKRLAAMEEKLAKQTSSDEPHPDIVKLNEELEDLTEDIKENKDRQASVIAKSEGIKEKINILKGKIEATEDADTKDRYRNQIDDLKDQLENKYDQWKSIGKENERLHRKAKSIESQRKQVESDLKTRREEASNQEQSEKEWQEDQGFRYATAVKALADIYVMTPGQHRAIGKLIKDDFREFIKKHPEGDPIDLVKFVAVRAKHHTAEFGIKSKYAKTGEDKKQVVVRAGEKRATKPPTAAAQKSDRKDVSTKVEEDARTARMEARKIMGAV